MGDASLVKSAMLLQVVKYTSVASGTVLLFDYCHTFTREVELIWVSPWNVGKVLFLLARYTAFVDVPLVLYYALAPNVSYNACYQVYAVSSYSTAFGIAVAEAIMLLRTYALYGRNRLLLAVLMSMLVASFLPVIVILVFFLRSLKYGRPPLPTVVGCYPTEGSKILFADFAMLMLLETIIMALTVWIDGIFYFVYLFLVSAGNIIVLVAGPPEFVDLLNTFQRVMHSVLSTRIMLHVRDSIPRLRSTADGEQSTATALVLTTIVTTSPYEESSRPLIPHWEDG